MDNDSDFTVNTDGTVHVDIQPTQPAKPTPPVACHKEEHQILDFPFTATVCDGNDQDSGHIEEDEDGTERDAEVNAD
ncbi:MAG: hypothetical protein LAO20_12045 [Acidobacteriia bacterium]|nr:hypothetical protein [Terriglobia bacterium]